MIGTHNDVMTSTTAPLLRRIVFNTAVPDAVSKVGGRRFSTRLAPRWRWLVGRVAALMYPLSVANPTPSEQAMSDLSPVDRPTR